MIKKMCQIWTSTFYYIEQSVSYSYLLKRIQIHTVVPFAFFHESIEVNLLHRLLFCYKNGNNLSRLSTCYFKQLHAC